MLHTAHKTSFCQVPYIQAIFSVWPPSSSYGRNPRGQPSILKESWTGENTTSASLAQPIKHYLVDLRSKLSEATEFGKSHSDAAQQSYAAHYNLGSRMKSVQEGDQVIVLAPENSDKMCNRWLGPGTVVKVKSLHSYLIDLGNDNVRHLHANKMRHFVPVYKVVA